MAIKEFLKSLKEGAYVWQLIDAHIILGKDNKSCQIEANIKDLDSRLDWVYLDDVPMEFGDYHIFSNNGEIFAYVPAKMEETWVSVL